MPSVEIVRSYRWDPQAVDRLVAAFSDLSQEVADDRATFAGSAEDASEPGQTFRFQSPAEFVPFAATAGVFTLRLGHYGDEASSVSLGRFAAEDPAELRVAVPLGKRAQALSAIGKFEHAARLTPIATDQGGDRSAPTVSLRRRYRAPQRELDALLELFVSSVAPVGDSPTPRISAMLELEQGEGELRLSDLDSVRANLGQPIRSLDLSLGYRTSRASMTVDRRRGELSVNVSVLVGRRDAAIAAMAAFEQAAGIVLLGEGDREKPKRGLRVSCFSRRRLEAPWLDSLLAAIAQVEPSVRHGSGQLELHGDSVQHSFGDVPSAVNEARVRWDKVLVMRLNLWGESCELSLLVEPKLDLVELEVRSGSEAETRTAIDGLENALGLEEHADIAYRRPRTSRRYRFRTFDRQKVATALRTVIGDFVSSDPIVRKHDSYVAESDDEGNRNYESFDRLDPFLEKIAGKTTFVEARIVALGPRNRIVSILILDDRTKLEVKSGFDAAGFQDLAAALEKLLPLTEDSTASESAEQKTVWQQIKRLDGLYGKAVVGAAIVLSSVTTFVVQRLIPKDSLALVTPSSVNGAPRAVAAGCIPIEWEVRGPTLLDQDRTLLQETGTVQVDAGDGRRVATLTDFRSGNDMFVPPGRWVVYIYDPARRRRSPSVTIDAAGAAATGGTVGKPRRCVGGRPAD